MLGYFNSAFIKVLSTAISNEFGFADVNKTIIFDSGFNSAADSTAHDERSVNATLLMFVKVLEVSRKNMEGFEPIIDDKSGISGFFCGKFVLDAAGIDWKLQLYGGLIVG